MPIPHRALLLAASVMMLPGAASAQTYMVRKVPADSTKGYDTVHISKAAMAGERIRLWAGTLVNPDCTVAGTMDTRIADEPRHGKVMLSDDPVFPNFLPPNPRTVCNSRRVPGKQAFYTADAGFHGHDKVTLFNATSEGRVRRIVIDIDVQ